MTKPRQRWLVMAVTLLMTLAFSGLGIRLLRVQWAEHEQHVAEATRIHTYKFPVKARRGDIVDARGNLLATSVPVKSVCADLIKLGDVMEARARRAAKRGLKFDAVVERGKLAATLAPMLDMTTAEVAARLQHPRAKFVVIKRRIEIDEWEKIAALQLPGICATDQYQRRYPMGQLGVQTVGYVGRSAEQTDVEETGQAGVEAAMDGWLRGTDGWVVTERNRRGHELALYRKQDVPPRQGCTVRLTIDPGIQQIVEEETDIMCATNRPKAACVVVMDPRTGEILAMVNRPTCDPIDAQVEPEQGALRNRCVSDTFEPGSTFKIATIGAALNEGCAGLNDMVYCENGTWFHAGRPLRDHHGYGSLSVLQVLQKSSNIGFAKLALRLGPDRLHRYVSALGFGRRRMAGQLPAEQPGVFRPVSRWTALSITRIPMGHEVTATPMQMVNAMSAVVNGGTLMQPRLVREVRDSDGRLLKEYPPVEEGRVLSAETSRQVVQALISVVSREGTARSADVPGYTVGGKTGTTEKWDNDAKSYKTGKYVSSFIGFLPALNPQFVITIMVDEPQGGKHYGGEVAAPPFAAMARRIANHLDIPPDAPEKAQPAREVAAR